MWLNFKNKLKQISLLIKILPNFLFKTNPPTDFVEIAFVYSSDS